MVRELNLAMLRKVVEFMSYEKELEVAIQAAKSAAIKILEIYHQGVEVKTKQDDTPVTRADTEANDDICRLLANAYPDYGMLSEEYADDLERLEKEYCWIVDPLDGTKEFIKMNDEFSINIALSKGREVVMGLIYMPVFDELYYAVKGEGAFTIGPKGIKRRIRVSKRIHRLRALKSRSHHASRYTELLERYKDRIASVKCAGSAYKGCLIAKGDYDLYYNYGKTMVWDTAAMDVIITEAGGCFAQTDGTAFEYNVKNTANRKGFMAVNRPENFLHLPEKTAEGKR